MALRWRRSRSTDDFAAEVRAHLDHEADRLRTDGVAPDEARRLAMREFGSVAEAIDRFHESRRWLGISSAWAQSVWLDVRHAARLVTRAPGLCITVALTLSLGLGVGASLLAVFTGLFLRPNVAHDPSTFAKVFVSTSGGEWRTVRGEPTGATLEELDALRQGSRALTDVTASAWATFRMSGPVTGRLRGLWVSCNYLRSHVPAIVLGRTMVDGDCDATSARVGVLSARAWARVFGRAADVIGRHVLLNGRAVEIVGVAADMAVRDPVAAEVFLPFSQRPDVAWMDAHSRGQDAWLGLSGRLAPGATLAAAQREALALVDAVNQPRGRSSTVRVTSGAPVFDPSAGKYLPMLVAAGSVAVFLVLVLACANAAMLLLARTVAREGEWAMRLRLGAPPGRIVRQVLLESAVVALPAWGLALGLASWAPAIVLRRLSEFPLSIDVTPDWRVWVVTCGLTMAAGAFTGLAAARNAAAAPITAAASTATPSSHAWLLVPQLATCVVLAAGTTALTVAGQRWMSPDVPYETGTLAVATLYDDADVGARRSVSMSVELADTLRQVPGVTHTALASPAPFSGDTRTVVRGPNAEPVATSVRAVSADYFSLAQVETVRGRVWDGTEQSVRPDGSVAVLVSEALAHRLGGVDPPSRLELGGGRRVIVVGVVADSVSLRPDQSDGPLLYLPVGASDTPAISVLARGDSAPAALLSAVRASADGSIDSTIDTLSTILARSGASYRTGREVLGAVAVLGLVLAVVGTSGAVAFQLRRRRRETALRLALGATRRRLIVDSVAFAVAPVLVGVLAGAALSLVLGLAWRPARADLASATGTVVLPVLVVTAAALVAAAVASARAVFEAVMPALRAE